MKIILSMLINTLVVTATYSQWQWQNPKPTGNDLHDIKFIDTHTGWFVGGNGTIFKTTDDGKHWLQQSGNPQYDFSCLYAHDANHLWAATGRTEGDFEYFSILFSSDGGNNWIEQVNGMQLSNDTLNLRLYSVWSIDFISDTIGWAVGDSGLILRTTDGGSHWDFNVKSLDYGLKTVDFLSDSLGFMCGGRLDTLSMPSPSPLSVSKGIILRTTNGGTQWDTLYADTIAISKAYFRDSMLGWALGASLWIDQFNEGELRWYILKTTDGGLTWNIRRSSDLQDLIFTNNQRGWAIGGWGALLTTTDGGELWFYTNPTQRFIRRLYKIHFTDTLHGYIVGSDGAIIQTTDGGQSWVHYDSKTVGSYIDDIFFVNPDTGWFVQSDLYRTVNGGDTWRRTGLSGLRRIYCYDRNNCWACGYNGQIVYSSDVGNSWVQQNSGVTDELRGIKFVSPLIGWTGYGFTSILKTTDGGKTWFPQTTPNIGGLNKIVTQNSNNVWVYGNLNNEYTTDGGTTWKLIDGLAGMFFLNPDTGWARNLDTLYRTFNGGQLWEPLGHNTGATYTTQFTSIDLGWTVFPSSVRTTTDGGRIWKTDVMVNVYHLLWHIQFSDTNHGWIAGNGGTLIRYGYPEKLTSVDDNPNEHPFSYRLYQNYPNPFNSMTMIKYELQSKTHVMLKIYDILGREIKTLIDNVEVPGSYTITWDGKNHSGLTMPSGVYFYELNTNSLDGIINSFRQVKKLLYIK